MRDREVQKHRYGSYGSWSGTLVYVGYIILQSSVADAKQKFRIWFHKTVEIKVFFTIFVVMEGSKLEPDPNPDPYFTLLVTNGSRCGSGRPKNIRILRIHMRIRNTAVISNYCRKYIKGTRTEWRFNKTVHKLKYAFLFRRGSAQRDGRSLSPSPTLSFLVSPYNRWFSQRQ
jgi:hypothetical protein